MEVAVGPLLSIQPAAARHAFDSSGELARAWLLIDLTGLCVSIAALCMCMLTLWPAAGREEPGLQQLLLLAAAMLAAAALQLAHLLLARSSYMRARDAWALSQRGLRLLNKLYWNRRGGSRGAS
jgi:hypothetical protein